MNFTFTLGEVKDAIVEHAKRRSGDITADVTVLIPTGRMERMRETVAIAVEMDSLVSDMKPHFVVAVVSSEVAFIDYTRENLSWVQKEFPESIIYYSEYRVSAFHIQWDGYDFDSMDDAIPVLAKSRTVHTELLTFRGRTVYIGDKFSMKMLDENMSSGRVAFRRCIPNGTVSGYGIDWGEDGFVSMVQYPVNAELITRNLQQYISDEIVVISCNPMQRIHAGDVFYLADCDTLTGDVKWYKLFLI